MNTNDSNEPQGHEFRSDQVPGDATMPEAVDAGRASGAWTAEGSATGEGFAAPEPVAPTMPAERIAPSGDAPGAPSDDAPGAPFGGAPGGAPGDDSRGMSPPPGAGAGRGDDGGSGAGRGNASGPFRRQGAWVAVVLTIVGGLVALSTLGTSIWDSAIAMPSQSRGDGYVGGWGGPGPWQEDVPTFDWSDSIAVDDVESIVVDGRSSELTIRYGGVDAATLDISTTAGSMPDWRFEVEDGVLTVRESDTTGGARPFGWSSTSATLTLPDALQESAPALAATMQSGALSIVGDYGTVELAARSGALSFEGAASSIHCDLQSGAGDLTVYDADEVALSVGSGVLGVNVHGNQPASTVLDVRSGYGELTLPTGAYNLTGTASSGARDVDVETSSTADATLEVNVSSGIAAVSQHGG
ncbi:hypothetical protein GCM10011490_27850 [Pseudoclavibacter endophyticus]|uniref:DUF4097 domain-containing protein n=1 Tax=Pseudoclavibacter endophyticus TaxID=1778590 RepID=A0A6H9WLK5_9MICO|nr:DUF4097 family beta strand repeat-containing protein [Pseudoclavibacter endophyticus]KAB1646792.1 DUF4097 domain-containing protein [Pseudoclavibacter endophyticus]GGA75509.1 hypothetical protein GCM10011490_27850 [Pseudoclavibacter endophyticus]